MLLRRDLVRRAIAVFLPLAVLATLTCGLVYAEVQQALRSGANDPQYQMAEDTASRLDAARRPRIWWTPPRSWMRRPASRPSRSSSTPVAGCSRPTSTLDGGQPVPPMGVLSAAKPGSPNAVTWQPREGSGSLQVTVAWSGGTVLVGRSLQRVEEQEWNTELIAERRGWSRSWRSSLRRPRLHGSGRQARKPHRQSGQPGEVAAPGVSVSQSCRGLPLPPGPAKR